MSVPTASDFTVMHNRERFVDTGKRLTSFADEVLVACSGCGVPGVVHATWVPYRWNARFECGACRMVLSSEAGHWVGAVRSTGRRPCGHCGHQWLTPVVEYDAPPPDPPDEIPADCPECGHRTMVGVSFSRVFPQDACCDPHFGLPLRLATATRHGVVWACNLRYLDELSGYVTAKLRVRRGGGNGAMFSRLPKWMKLAKNRDEIVKALSKLGAKA